MRTTMKAKVIDTVTSTATGEPCTYELRADHKLYCVYDGGEFECGSVMNLDAIDTAVFNFEEEMMALMADARAEFGGAK